MEVYRFCPFMLSTSENKKTIYIWEFEVVAEVMKIHFVWNVILC